MPLAPASTESRPLRSSIRDRQTLTDVRGNILYQNQRVQFNDAGLKEVAQIADGQFFRATDTKSLEEIYRDIDKMEKSTVTREQISAIPRPVSGLHHGRLRLAPRAGSPVANDLEETAMNTTDVSAHHSGCGDLLHCPVSAFCFF